MSTFVKKKCRFCLTVIYNTHLTIINDRLTLDFDLYGKQLFWICCPGA